jgi:hypothetical protein
MNSGVPIDRDRPGSLSGAMSAWRGLALAVFLACGATVALGPRTLEIVHALNAWSMGTRSAPDVCSFRARTGLPCVGCGGTHAFALGVRGAFPDAVRANPLGAFVAAAAWILWLGAGVTLVSGRVAALKVPLLTTALLLPVVFVGTFVWWWWALPPGTLVGQ